MNDEFGIKQSYSYAVMLLSCLFNGVFVWVLGLYLRRPVSH